MIKNPKVGQEVWYFSNDHLRKGVITFCWEICNGQKQVEIAHHRHNRKYSEIFNTEKDAEKQRPKEISKLLKNLNEEILRLSQKRENLATKLAKLLEKGR